MRRQCQRLRPRCDIGEIVQAVLGDHMRHALARAFAPQRDHDPFAGGLQRVHVLGQRLEYIGVGCVALGREIVAGMRADIDGFADLVGRGERRQLCQRRSVEAFTPFALGEIEPVRRQWLIGRAAARHVGGLLARLKIVGDLDKPLVRGFFGERFDGDRACRRYNRTAFPFLDGTAAANAPCRHSAGPR